MKQLLLRIPEDLHSRLTAQARANGESVNALATSTLEATFSQERLTERDRVRLRARAAGLVPHITSATPLTDSEYRHAVQSLRGLGPVLDEILDDERGS